jgi:hypothetical protein
MERVADPGSLCGADNLVCLCVGDHVIWWFGLELSLVSPPNSLRQVVRPLLITDGVADMLLCEVTGKLCFFCAISMAVADTVLFLARTGGLPGVEHFCVLPAATLRHVFRLYVCMRSSNRDSKSLL